MADELDGVPHKKSDGRTSEVRGLGRLDDERSGEISPTIGGTVCVSLEFGAIWGFLVVTYKTIALARER